MNLKQKRGLTKGRRLFKTASPRLRKCWAKRAAATRRANRAAAQVEVLSASRMLPAPYSGSIYENPLPVVMNPYTLSPVHPSVCQDFVASNPPITMDERDAMVQAVGCILAHAPRDRAGFEHEKAVAYRLGAVLRRHGYQFSQVALSPSPVRRARRMKSANGELLVVGDMNPPRHHRKGNSMKRRHKRRRARKCMPRRYKMGKHYYYGIQLVQKFGKLKASRIMRRAKCKRTGKGCRTGRMKRISFRRGGKRVSYMRRLPAPR